MGLSTFEVVIVGGSYAGLAAAMTLGRSLRSVLVVDSGIPCNRFAPHSHNFITHDGREPAAIAAMAREQVLAYPSVHFWQDTVTRIEGADMNFEVETAAAGKVLAQKILFATGLEDVLAEIPGLADCWGKSVIHCPYCHGYEVRGKRTGIWSNSGITPFFAKLIQQWTPYVTVFSNGPANFDTEAIANLGIPLIETGIAEIQHQGGYLHCLKGADGSEWILDALYHHAPFRQKCPIPQQLGCAFTEMGHIVIDAQQMTSIPGIYAAGDATTPFRSVSVAVSGGNLAGAMINHGLVEKKV